ncbi:hypothetical protein SAMN05444004_101542 [Jannaschia faecimaris]|uniref:Uncharacterized protein n=1 Tax=Jannaschia faecimaris TaxID=1244108 RepID=A0A1H3K7C3_9RHOB|nr:hypothetical protein [Jannaschia faecimaris]SDY48033.1 hypothetical protein SAMN05444004_101542 [Jannaschia faecimaris]
MRGLILFDDLFEPDDILLARAADWAMGLQAFDKVPSEVLTLPWSKSGDLARQLFAVGLIAFNRYQEVCVLQRQGLCVQVPKLYLLEPRDGGGFHRIPVHDGVPQKADAIMRGDA